MKVIAFLNEKGGVGKSTLASNIATALHRQGRAVLLIDADPQGTARDWRAASPPGVDLPVVIGVDRPQLLADAIRSQRADYVIIDGPAKADQMTAAIVRVANLALLVIQPSGADVWASATAVMFIQTRREIGGKIDAAFLINRTSHNTKLSKVIGQGDWNQYGIEQLSATVGNRVAFAQALTDGVSVFDLPDAAARADVSGVIAELEAAQWL